jgi:hypothetical protein
MNEEYPGTTISYLDASFPFFDGFPLAPHLSHDDGKKLDLSFTYLDASTGKRTSDIPSFIGYGVCEEPHAGEKNIPDYCRAQGAWQYSLLLKLAPQQNKRNFRFDPQRNKKLINLIAGHNKIGKIFIEPHLKTRMGLQSTTIRFHGCKAVRHDDHIHIQLK